MSEERPEDREEGKFKVSDRRMFTSEGEVKPSEEHSEERTRKPPQSQEADRSPDFRASSGQQAPEIDFSAFLLSLATSAMAHLGELPDPSTGESEENLEAAKQMIDILSILQEKTQGNLEGDEKRLLDDLLYELRMKYLKKTKKVQL